MEENINLKSNSQDIVETIEKKNKSLIYLGISELMKAMKSSPKKEYKKNKNQISEEEVSYQTKRNKRRPPIIIN